MPRKRWIESNLQHAVIARLKRQGAMLLNVHGHAMQKAGYPDLCITHWKFVGWLELKVDDRQLTTLQKITLDDLVLRNAKAMIGHFGNYSGEFTLSIPGYEDTWADPFDSITNMAGFLAAGWDWIKNGKE